jgi:hypothetical protein
MKKVVVTEAKTGDKVWECHVDQVTNSQIREIEERYQKMSGAVVNVSVTN